MIYTYTLTGEVPSKKNGRIATRSGRNFPSQAYVDWHRSASLQVIAQGRPVAPITKCRQVAMRFYHADKHRRDTNNQMASVFDLLVDCRVLADDNWRVTGEEVGVGILCGKDKPRCEIVIFT